MNKDVKVSDRITLRETPEELYFTYKQRRAARSLFTLLSCISLMFVTASKHVELGGAIFAMMFIVAFYFAYISLTNMVNKLCITVTKKYLRVTEGPMPRLTDIYVDMRRANGLRIKSKLYTKYFGSDDAEVFDIYCRDKNDVDRLAIKHVIDIEEALLMAMQIAQFLGVESKNIAHFLGEEDE